MDEQTRLNLEQRLEDVLRRDLGAIPVRPFAMYNRSPRAATVHPIRRVFSIAGAAAVIAVVILVALAAAFALRELKPTPATVPVPSSTPSGSPSPSSAASAQPSPAATQPISLGTPSPAGAITGGLGYPGGAVPPVTVYAFSTADERVWYSVDVPQVPPASGSPPRDGSRYTITGVAPGTYWVLAYRNDRPTVTLPDPGLWSVRFACRTGPAPTACSDDPSLAIVTVIAGQTTTGIDVQDWVLRTPGRAGQPSIPPRPTPR
jgi:hypothetical protein